ncbi:MAG: NAD(P)-dependent oxidoreductase [Anaerolineales bacterium]|nr:NAD(P)-dependent oxidoreductase [Anaerolineales bacterium]
MSRKVLITGGSGFIGVYLLRRLAERGDTVVNLDIRPPNPGGTWYLGPYAEQIQYVQGGVDDVTEVLATVEQYRPDTIVHIAGIVDLAVLAKRHALGYRVNVGGTLNLLEAAHMFGVKRMVYFSSIAVLPARQYEPIDVNHPVFLASEGPGESFYGASKVASEAFMWAYHQAFDLDFISIRPSAVYGFGQGFPIFIKPMVENSCKGLPTRFETGREFPRDYTHVDDVAQLAVQAIDVSPADIKDRVFYAATGRPLVTAGEVADVVKEILPGADIEIGSGLSEQDLIEIRYRGVLSIKNAQEQLGFKPRFANIYDGVKDYIETYQRYLADTKKS